MSEPKPEPCNYCRAMIIWATSPAGKPMPVDATPAEKGNILVYPTTTPATRPSAAVLNTRQAAGARAEGRPTYLHHATSCPHASQWNRGAAKTKAHR